MLSARQTAFQFKHDAATQVNVAKHWHPLVIIVNNSRQLFQYITETEYCRQRSWLRHGYAEISVVVFWICT